MTPRREIACSDERRGQLADLGVGRIDEAASEDLLRHVEACPTCSRGLDLVADLASAAAGARSPRRRVAWVAPFVAAAAAAAMIVVAAIAFLATREDAVSRLADLRPPGLVATAPRGEGDALPEDALRAFEQGRFAEAAAAFEARREASPAHPLLAHYAGVAHLLAGDARAAAARLEMAAAASTGLLREASLWYLAQAFLVRGDARSARDALEKLAAEGGDYAPNAEASLAQLAAAGH